MNNTTSILNSFENGSFYTNKNYSGIFYTDIQNQLNHILMWVNTNLNPAVSMHVKDLDKNAISDCIELAVSLGKKFSEMVAVLRNTHLKCNQDHSYLYTICNDSACLCNSNKSGFWRALQEHENTEVALNLKIGKQIPFVNLTKKEPKLKEGSLNMNNKQPVLHKLTQNVSGTDISLVANCFKEVPQLPCSECDCNNDDSFKFNFIVDYNPKIKTLLYGSKFLEEIEVNGVTQPTVQFRDGNFFVCLLCNIEGGYDKSLRNIREHINGQRHKKNKSKSIFQALAVYHKNWMKMELAYQAHQSHFFPSDTEMNLCCLCYAYVRYEELELHILSEKHKGCVIKLSRKENHSPLIDIQASVYLSDVVDVDDLTNVDVVDEKKEIKELRSKQRIAANLDREKTDSEESEEDKSKSLSEPNSKLPCFLLNIIKSVANPSGKLLSDILEHRFHLHLNFIELVANSKGVKCTCCKVLLPGHPQDVKIHLLSKLHLSQCNLKVPGWHFYCEICDFHCARNETWTRHLADGKHAEWCGRLGSVRQTKLCEYECLTCNSVIFGDELSLKRHVRGRKRRKKEIILSAEVKEAFKTEKIIQDTCEGLVEGANKVLSNSAPLLQCCRALEVALSEVFENCTVYPFGSRVSGLGNDKSDLDVFVDTGDMYLGEQNQDVQSQEKFVKNACKVFRKKRDEFSHLNPIATARTPIVQIFHKGTDIDCDLSFRHGLSVENTKFLRFCIRIQPVTQSLILLLKKWITLCKLHENINTYALSMLVIYFLQVKNYLPAVQDLKVLNLGNILIIDGWTVPDFSILYDSVEGLVVTCNKSIKQLLIEFFDFYKGFDYLNDIVCPLLGRPVKKSVLAEPNAKEAIPLEMLPYAQKLDSPNAEVFRAKSNFCIQDPFDLSHNLAKACTQGTVNKLIAYCDLSSKYLKTIK